MKIGFIGLITTVVAAYLVIAFFAFWVILDHSAESSRTVVIGDAGLALIWPVLLFFIVVVNLVGLMR